MTFQTKWTDEHNRQLVDLWPDISISARQIAARLGGGLTRNSVIGRAHRLIAKGTLKARGNINPPRRAPRPRPWEQLGISERTYFRRQQQGRPLSCPLARPSVHEIPPGNPLTEPEFQCVEPDMPRLKFWELSNTPTPIECRWPLDDPPRNRPEQTYCGKPNITGSSYCMFHFLKSRNPR